MDVGVDVGVDVGALRWGEPVTNDTGTARWLPSVAALDNDRLFVACGTMAGLDRSPASCAAVGQVAGSHRRYWVQEP